MIYLDSSATLKLLIDEAETAALRAWLTARGADSITSSHLTTVEVVRACRRHRPDVLPRALALLQMYDLLPVSREVLANAAEVGDPVLRSLDALHLASALSVAEHLTAFVAYDHRLAEAALAVGLPVIRPS